MIHNFKDKIEFKIQTEIISHLIDLLTARLQLEKWEMRAYNIETRRLMIGDAKGGITFSSDAIQIQYNKTRNHNHTFWRSRGRGMCMTFVLSHRVHYTFNYLKTSLKRIVITDFAILAFILSLIWSLFG